MNARANLRTRVESYLAYRRHAGYALHIEGQQLAAFVCFAEQTDHHGPLTLELAVRWATASKGKRRLTAARRIEVLRPIRPVLSAVRVRHRSSANTTLWAWPSAPNTAYLHRRRALRAP